MPIVDVNAISLFSHVLSLLTSARRVSFALLCVISLNRFLWAQQSGSITGTIADPTGARVAGAKITLRRAASVGDREVFSNGQGGFEFRDLRPGKYRLVVEAPGFSDLELMTTVSGERTTTLDLQFGSLSAIQQITVHASSLVSLATDPAQVTFPEEDVIAANPGRPGAPVSIPGLPIETASGGIKAPQYFAPGVAGDHGEPIAQYFQIGDFLFPNNLPANAHGNGYADPNVLIPATIDGVTIDGGAFDVREGNNAVDLSATYIPKERLSSFLQITGDQHDGDVVAGWSPKNPTTDAWLAAEVSFGNGFLKRPEHRQQYKLNGLRKFNFGDHTLSLIGTAYYGFSYVPGLIPIDTPVPGDTIDNRQLDHTYNFVAAATDDWRISAKQEMTFSAFFRNYGLTLRSDFGDGLIQQSETRNILGGEFLYSNKIRSWMSITAGTDLRRDAPRGLDLKHLSGEGIFDLVTSNNLSLALIEPFISIGGSIRTHLHYDLGIREEAVWMDNEDLVNRQNSFNKLASLSLPKVSVTFLPGDRSWAPTVALSYGEAFHTEDPRIGNGTGIPNLLAPSRAYQMLVTKDVKQTRLSVALRRVSNSQELAKIDPDTGLQEVIGPSINKVVSISVEHHYARGTLFVSYAQADARQTQTGEPVPEAPRTIVDASASVERLPFHLRAKGEFEYVKAKPLGDGFTGVPVREIRGAILRAFRENRVALEANFLLPGGYTGQTTEVLAFPTNSPARERTVGVPLKTWFGLTCTYNFRR